MTLSSAPTSNALETTSRNRRLDSVEFHTLADVPAEVEWLANITSPNTRRAYKNDVTEFSRFVGLTRPEDMRQVTRAHVIAWRDGLKKKDMGEATIRRKLSALSSLFDYLCEKNAITHNPVKGVKRPLANINEGKTPALGNAQARRLLEAPAADTLKGKRDRAILAVLLFHGLRREEVAGLKIRDMQSRQGVMHFEVRGKGSKTRFVAIQAFALRLIDDYLDEVGHGDDLAGPLFRPVKNNTTGTLDKPLHPHSIYKDVVMKYAAEIGLKREVVGICAHAMRATAATNALDHEADIAKVQQWLGHANISTTKLYDRRDMRPEESPTFRVKY